MKKLLVGLVVLLVAAAAIGFVTPKDYDVARSVTIDAPRAAVHAYVGHLDQWDEWTPWQEDDPTVETTVGDQATGVGASQTWTSADGAGELTFTMCDPNEGIACDMTFIMEEQRIPAQSAILYETVEGGTRVTWSMQGTWDGAMPPVIDGWMKILSPMMLGGMFDRGLANLKAKVEA